MRITEKHKKILFLLVKWLVFTASIIYIVWVFRQKQPGKFLVLQEPGTNTILLILITFLIMPLNWGMESRKWQLLVRKFQAIPFKKAFQAVLAGLTINNWIPNRVAEFLGRMYFIKDKGKAISSTLFGNMAQLTTTFLLGSLGALFWLELHQQFLFWLLFLLIAVTLLLAYFRINHLTRWLDKQKIFRKMNPHWDYLNKLTFSDKARVLLFAFGRFSIYVLQYSLLLFAFGISLEYPVLISAVASIFLIQAVLPALAFTEIGIRGAVVLFVFETFNLNIHALLSAAFGLWLINVLLPTLLGAVFILAAKKEVQT